MLYNLTHALAVNVDRVGSLIAKGFIFEVSSQSLKRREAEKRERHHVARARVIILLRNQLTNYPSPVPYIYIDVCTDRIID